MKGKSEFTRKIRRTIHGKNTMSKGTSVATREKVLRGLPPFFVLPQLCTLFGFLLS